MTRQTLDPQRSSPYHLVIVSNRLPYVVRPKPQSGYSLEPGSGGLVTALAPVLRNRGGLWIGWPGVTEREDLNLPALLAPAAREAGYRLEPVPLDEDDLRDFYQGFANEIIWPLFHDLPSRCNFNPVYWDRYQAVNRKYCQVIVKNLHPQDYIWVHDYHLMDVAQNLRGMGVSQNIGFFLHIPFPPLDNFLKLPWRFHILRSLLAYDLLGFQTSRDRRNFLGCVRALHKDLAPHGKGQVVMVKNGARQVRVGVFPISIDFNEFADRAATPAVSGRAQRLSDDLPQQQMILGLDRLDYTKGIPERLEAYKEMFLRHPEMMGRVALVQVVVPSRADIPEYMGLKKDIERQVSAINGQFTSSGWVPIHYMFRSLDRSELLAYYRSADIALVTPLRDGMNLVAKEYCASKSDEQGVLVLSEFAGSAAQLHRWAMLVNPHDRIGMAEAIYQALHLKRGERQQRMRRLRASVRRQDIFWWVNSFLKAAFSKELGDFPLVEEYLPSAPPQVEPPPLAMPEAG